VASSGVASSGVASSGVGGIGSQETPAAHAERDLIGVLREREHNAVAGAPEQDVVDAGERGCHGGDLPLDLLDGFEVEVGPEAEREL
jgi:hypothetical protein